MQTTFLLRPLSLYPLNGRSTDALKKAPVEKELGKNCIVVSLLLDPQKRSKGHLIPLLFFLRNRLTADNPLVKNLPFKESTNDGLI